MLITSPIGCAPRFLGLGGVIGDAVTDAQAAGEKVTLIAGLQQALVDLSKVKQKPAINPGTFGLVNGRIPDATMNALAAAISSISPNEMPALARIALAAALAFGATTDTAKSYVEGNAAAITAAIKATTVASTINKASNQPAPAPKTAAETPFFASQGVWYKTWWGIGAIGIGVAGVLALLLARREPAPATAPAKAISGRRSRR